MQILRRYQPDINQIFCVNRSIHVYVYALKYDAFLVFDLMPSVIVYLFLQHIFLAASSATNIHILYWIVLKMFLFNKKPNILLCTHVMLDMCIFKLRHYCWRKFKAVNIFCLFCIIESKLYFYSAKKDQCDSKFL